MDIVFQTYNPDNALKTFRHVIQIIIMLGIHEKKTLCVPPYHAMLKKYSSLFPCKQLWRIQSLTEAL